MTDVSGSADEQAACEWWRGARPPVESAEEHPADAGRGQAGDLQHGRSADRGRQRTRPFCGIWSARHRGAVARRRAGDVRGPAAARSCYPAAELGRPRLQGAITCRPRRRRSVDRGFPRSGRVRGLHLSGPSLRRRCARPRSAGAGSRGGSHHRSRRALAAAGAPSAVSDAGGPPAALRGHNGHRLHT